MTSRQMSTQYSTGLSRQHIERALVAAGKDLGHLQPADLGALEDFHALGRIATSQLAELAKVTGEDRVLDAGTGIGGTARFLAAQHGCEVIAIDLTEEYCETARWLNQLVGLDDKITVRQGDVTQLPFGDASFDVVISQHVQMNVADKARLYAEARRVLAPGGRLAIWDITAGGPGELDYPLPWADQPGRSYLAAPGELRAAIESAGLEIAHWADLTEPAAALMEAVLARPPEPLGLHAFVPGFAAKAGNLARGLADGRLRVIQGVALRSGPRTPLPASAPLRRALSPRRSLDTRVIISAYLDTGDAVGRPVGYRAAFSGSSPLAIMDSRVRASWSRLPGSAW